MHKIRQINFLKILFLSDFFTQEDFKFLQFTRYYTYNLIFKLKRNFFRSLRKIVISISSIYLKFFLHSRRMSFAESVLQIQISSRRNCYNSFGSRIARERPLTRSSKHSNELRRLLGVVLLIRQQSYLPKYPIAPRSKKVLFASQCVTFAISFRFFLSHEALI